MGKKLSAKQKKRKKKKAAQKRRAAKKKQIQTTPGHSVKPEPEHEPEPMVDEDAPSDLVEEDEYQDDQIARVMKILGVDDDEEAGVNEESLTIYFEHLKAHLDLPCRVTGIEDTGCFGWEEYYNFGPGSEREYKQLRKEYASFRDFYDILDFNEDWDEEEGLSVHVKRLSDQKAFTLTLADLKCTDKKSLSARLLDDYAVWFVNYHF